MAKPITKKLIEYRVTRVSIQNEECFVMATSIKDAENKAWDDKTEWYEKNCDSTLSFEEVS
tara:strand:- start:257 stop:439 length:183 start_codon:yes stop_codon:yes gene_type:complete